MIVQKYSYRKNFILNTIFIVLIAASLIAALVIAYNLTRKYVRNEFDTRKIDVLEETIKPYNNFFQNKIPEISFYQGYLDSTSAAKYSDTVFKNFPFINSILFYDTQISSAPYANAYKARGMYIAPRGIYQFRRSYESGFKVIHAEGSNSPISLRYMEEFDKMAGKLATHLETSDTTSAMVDEETYNVFYNLTPNRITFMNIPRDEELKIFKTMMMKPVRNAPVFEQDILSFRLNPFGLVISNRHPELYERIKIKPIVYESLDEGGERVVTEIPLSGAFADYKLYFSSSEEHLAEEVSRQFLPSALIILLIFSVLIFIGYLIYSNLYVNNRLFKLQYDFVNNLTHEFKTPVSVIKIAGNNIRSAKQLSDRERLHYGKILDEEADKLNDLMNRLLSFTQIENQSIKVKKEEVNLEVFVQNIIDSYHIKYPDFVINYEIRNIARYTTDPVLLTSLFQNLVDNAYKYSLPNKKELFIDVALEKSRLVFKFIDQGIGIPKEELKNIFKKFYRIQSQYNQQGSVGLGLAFCKELVNFMQGDIAVKSRVGIGSEFIITLPYTE